MQKESMSSVRVFYPKWTRKELKEKLRKELAELAQEFPISQAFLFGSWAKGNYTVASDIDLLVIYSGPIRKDAYRLVRKTIPQMELHFYSQAKFEQNQESIQGMLREKEIFYP